MDIRKIKKLIELLEQTDLTEIEVTEDKESVRLSRLQAASTTQVAVPAAMPYAPQPQQAGPAPQSAKEDTHHAAAATDMPSGHTLKSPMVGTFYLSASPGAKPFVEIGQQVDVGDVVCIIEAMKMFNQIEADVSGKITARLVENGDPIEFGQPLFMIE
ncbi:MAG: acetyl-CoA carboxylase biotin carboxyl carrier protein [Pseudomonadota bacterium]